MQTFHSEGTPTIRTTHQQIEELELDLAWVRTQIVALREESVSMATELLDVLEPLQAKVSKMLVEPLPPTLIAVDESFGTNKPAVREVSDDDASARPVLDLTVFAA